MSTVKAAAGLVDHRRVFWAAVEVGDRLDDQIPVPVYRIDLAAVDWNMELGPLPVGCLKEEDSSVDHKGSVRAALGLVEERNSAVRIGFA